MTFVTFPLSNVNTGVSSVLPPKIHLRYTCAFRTRVGSFLVIFRKFTPIRCIAAPSLSYFTSTSPPTPHLLTPHLLTPHLLTSSSPYKKNYTLQKSLPETPCGVFCGKVTKVTNIRCHFQDMSYRALILYSYIILKTLYSP